MQGRTRWRGRGVLLAGSLVVGGCYSGVASHDGAEPGADGAEPGADDGGSDAGDGADDGADDGPVGECAAQAAPAPLRRLTPLQYRNTVRDLFGDPELDPAYDDEEIVTTQRGVRQLRSGAEAILVRRDQWTQPVFPCATDGEPDEACAQDFVATFGRRVFRRPPTETETQWLMGVYQAAAAELPFADAMDVLLATMLQAPAFVYRIETGQPVEGVPEGIRRLDDHEMASRLSYFLWDTMPDDALFAAADAGELTGDDGLRAQVERMLADPRAEAKLQDLVSQWLQLDGGQLHFALEETPKDAELFPQYGPPLQDAMRTEVEGLVRRVFFEQDAAFGRLFTERAAYVNGPLAELYGVAGPADADTWEWVELPEDRRAGLLTRAAFLTVYGGPRAQSPIRRGVYVIEQLFCTPLGEPPPNANDTPVDGGEVEDDDGNTVVRTVREDVEARTQTGECAGCHGIVNPAGFTFEHYDAIGRWQDEEIISGLPVDSSGELVVGDVAGPVADAVELSEKLASSEDVRRCFAERWMAGALGQAPDAIDDCTRADVIDRFAADGDMRQLVVGIVLSDAFRFVGGGEGQ